MGNYRQLPSNLKFKINNPQPTTVYKQEWHVIAGRRIFFRSRWEYRYALYLQLLKEHNEIIEWEHEPQTFWFDKVKRGVVSYLPDFRITHKNGTYEFVECKGYMDSKSATKIKRMAKYFPEVKLRVVDKDWFHKNNPTLKNIIKEWK